MLGSICKSRHSWSVELAKDRVVSAIERSSDRLRCAIAEHPLGTNRRRSFPLPFDVTSSPSQPKSTLMSSADTYGMRTRSKLSLHAHRSPE